MPELPVYEAGEESLTPAVSITIKNYGQVDMTFEPLCCELEVKGATAGRVVMKGRQVDPRLPATIKHGQNIKIITPIKGIQEALKELSSYPKRKVRASVKDAIGRRFHSTWMVLMLLDEY